MYRIQDLHKENKPRERLVDSGAQDLKLKELLAVILGTGTPKEGVLELSGRIIEEYGQNIITTYQSVEQLKQDFGVSHVKACQIISTLEIGRRLFAPQSQEHPSIRSAEDVASYVSDMSSFRKEYVRGLYVNTRNVLIHDEIISIGSLDQSLVHPREVLQPAITHSAAALILVHNHPSQSLTPSKADTEITQTLKDACNLMQIQFLDHIIVTKHAFQSII